MRILEVEQGSQEWLEARAGVVTASEADEIVSPLWKVREAKSLDAYVARKLAEKWSGPLPQVGTFAMEQGDILQHEARNWYAFEFGQKVTTVGLIVTDDGRAGCSPDGIIEHEIGLEIKCPMPPAHVEYLIAGHVPPKYRPQVQFSLWVTKFAAWQFVSYRRGYPPLIVSVTPDPEAQEAIESAITKFSAKFDAGWSRLVELNGGKEPPKWEPMQFADEIQNEQNLDEVPIP